MVKCRFRFPLYKNEKWECEQGENEELQKIPKMAPSRPEIAPEGIETIKIMARKNSNNTIL